MGLYDWLYDRVSPRNLEIKTSQDLDLFIRGGEATWSGVDISPTTALTISAVFAAVRVISEDVGKLSFPVFDVESDGSKDVARGSHFWRLVHDMPNDRWTSAQFRETLTAHALLRGDAYALKVLVRGRVQELWPLDPTRVRVEQDDGFGVLYFVRPPDGGPERVFTRREIFHLPGLWYDGQHGTSVIKHARQSLGIARALERHGGTFFGQGAKPGAVVTHPGRLSEQASKRLAQSLDTDYSSEQSNRTLVLEEGMSITGIGFANDDAQFLESRQFSVQEIARWFRVSPHKIADLSRSSFNNIEQQNIEHDTDTLLPWAKRWDDATNGQIIPGESQHAELNMNSILRADTTTRWQAYAAAIQNRVMTRNEVRALEGLNPVDGGDVFENPAIDVASNEADPPADVAAQWRRVTKDVKHDKSGRITRIEEVHEPVTA